MAGAPDYESGGQEFESLRDSLKVLDPKRPIREADIGERNSCNFVALCSGPPPDLRAFAENGGRKPCVKFSAGAGAGGRRKRGHPKDNGRRIRATRRGSNSLPKRIGRASSSNGTRS